ncbi:aminoglycoside 6-adenylyltransferase [Mycobacterium sp. SMC-11]|uniref:aminoglycoside 6-adenylyltransferase n=1 Tax=Mycobacterium sp. SMC-11 TaxID=3385969 RepID=UPI00390CA1B5
MGGFHRRARRTEKMAEQTDSVRGVLVTGSAAAGAAHPLSDRDIEIYPHDVDGLLNDDSWRNALGEVLVVEHLENDQEQPTRLIYYVGGKLDFTSTPAGDLPTPVHTRPFQSLLDKDARARNRRRRPSKPRTYQGRTKLIGRSTGGTQRR